MALAEGNTTTSKLDRLGNIEQILRSNSEPQMVCLRSMRDLLQKLVTISMQEEIPNKKIQGDHLMNTGEGQVGSKDALLLQGSTPPTPSLRTEQQPYRLVIEAVVGTKKQNSDEYYVTKGKEIGIKVTITKLDGTPVRGDDPHASVTVELVVLPGNFYDPKVVTRWDKEAFEKSRNSLEGMTVENGIFQLNDGSAVHGLAKIMKNSGKKEVKLGVTIHEGNMSVGERRVFEGVSNPFKVKEPPRPPKNPEKRTTDSIAKEECKRYITETSAHRSTNGQHVYNNNIHPHPTTTPFAVQQGSQKQMASSHTIISPAPQHVAGGHHAMGEQPSHATNVLLTQNLLRVPMSSLSRQQLSSNGTPLHPTNPLAVSQGPAQSAQVCLGSQIEKMSSHPAITPTPQHGQQRYNNNTPLHLTTTPLGIPHGQQQSSSNTPLHLTTTPLVVPQGLAQSVQQFQEPPMHMLVSHLAIAPTQHGKQQYSNNTPVQLTTTPLAVPQVAGGHDGTGEQLSHATSVLLTKNLPTRPIGQQQSSNSAPLHVRPDVQTVSQGPTQNAQLISRSQVQMASSHSAITHPPHGDGINGSNAFNLALEALLRNPALQHQFELGLSVPTETQGTEPPSDQEKQYIELLVKTLQQPITMQPGNDTGDQNQPGPSFANQDEVVGSIDDCPSQNMECQPGHQASTLQAQDQTMSAGDPYDSLQQRMGGPAGLSEQYMESMEFDLNNELFQFLNLTNPNK